MQDVSTLNQQLKEELDKLTEYSGNSYLNLFQPRIRAVDPELQIVQLRSSIPWVPEQMCSTAPEGIPIYDGVWTHNRGEGLYMDSFARGVASLGFLIADDDIGLMHDLLVCTLEPMETYNVYPALVPDMAERSMRISLEILKNGESSNLPNLLAYNHGVWWGAGYIKDFKDPYIMPKSWRQQFIPEAVYSVMESRAIRAVMEDE